MSVDNVSGPTGEGAIQTAGWAATSADAPLGPFQFMRRALGADDVRVEIAYCGICHTDLHFARNDWGRTTYPIVPGHEIVGIVADRGSGATRHQVGDRVAIGTMVDSCRTCERCQQGLQQFCTGGSTGTYNAKDRVSGGITYGGYSDHIVVQEEFALRVPGTLDLSRIAPVLCAGVTTWSPLRLWKVGPGTRVAVAGLGGLGHMGVKLAAALGAEVTVLTTSPGKADDARQLGAHDVIITTDAEQVRSANGRFNLVLDTIPVPHDVAPLMALLGLDGVHVIVGMVDMIPSFHTGLLMGGRKILTGSPIGGLPETQELLDFCAEHSIHPDTETIAVSDINHAFERMERADVKYRFVIDMSTLPRS